MHFSLTPCGAAPRDRTEISGSSDQRMDHHCQSCTLDWSWWNWWVPEVSILSSATPLFHRRWFYRPVRRKEPVLVWQARPDSNRHPLPSTAGRAPNCVTNHFSLIVVLAHSCKPKLATHRGFEPLISAWTVRRPLQAGPMGLVEKDEQ